MTGIPESRQLWITPLSPVHMGTDEDYEPTGYVIEGNALYEFDQCALENLPEAERRSLNDLLDGRATPGMLKNVQAFFHKNREWLIPAAVNVVPVSDEMAKLYEDRVGRAANIEAGNSQVINALEIERAAYHPLDRRLLLPGSGLKGAIRTALLDRVNDGKPPRRNERNRDLQQRLFRYSMGELHQDPMRLVQVGDCAWCGPGELNSAEILFAVNRKKNPLRKDGRRVRSRAEQSNLYQLLECAAPFRFRAFHGTLSIANVSSLKQGSDQLPALKFGFKEIADACNRFYRPIFERELELLRNRGFLDTGWRETVENLLADEHIRRRLDSKEAFLLRVGRHSGAESVTLNGVRSIRIMQGKGRESKWESGARTLWLATGDKDDQRNLRPFGWLLVEVAPLGDTPPAWEAADAMTRQSCRSMADWLGRIREKQASLAQRLDQARKKKEQEALAEAEKRRLEEEQARRLAAMSEEERLMEEVRQQLERDRAAKRAEAGGELNQKRLKLLEAALTWGDPGLRRQAAGLLEETARLLPWAKKRRQEVREKLARLRDG